MTATLPHEIVWVAAAPLWKEAVRTPEVLRRPTLLGFGHDDFMEELLGTLAEKPERITDHLATGPSRSYRERNPGEEFSAKPTVKGNQLKLYQPVHGWFYLVTGSLVCQLPGLPDHPVDLGAEESAGFVLRRLTDKKKELALVADAFGKKFWKAVDQPEKLVSGEEVLPMFPLAFREADRRRKLLAGLIPTGNQDFFLAAPVGKKPPDQGGQPPDAVALEGVKARVTRAIDALQLMPDPTLGEEDQRPEISRFALMDLADFLKFYLPPVMQAVKDGSSLAGKAQALLQLLRNSTVGGTSYADLLKTILSLPLTTAFTHNLGKSITPASGKLGMQLQAALEEALQEAPSGVPAVPADVQRPGSTSFVARLVYRRPHCGPLKPEVVSPQSEPFVMAPYFDPEAPARPIRIAMPFDPSIRGLRQFKKNVRMVLSDALKEKVKRGSINDKMDGPGVDCGALELSIPIITIVAMIILFVFIAVLNIIFWWIPFVKICLPGVTIEPEPES